MERNSSSSSRRRDLGFQRASRSRNSPSSTSSSSSSSSSNWRSRTESEEESSAAVPTVVGTCSDMCPVKERSQRERLRDLSAFERLNGNPGKTSPSLAVKKFCRTISSNHVQPSDLRPPSVLQNTLKYLLNLVESSDHPFEVVHDFVFDRTRSIRQDLSMQNIVDSQAICMYEEMVKFHILSHQKLSRGGSKPDISSLYHLNMEQLMKCLLSLLDIYQINRMSNSISKNEAEFYSLYVLLHLGCKIPTMGTSLSLWFSQLPFSVLHSKEMQFCRTILRYFRMGNYKRFFSTTAAEATHLQLCLMEPLLNEVRALAISYINYAGYKLHPYPLAHLSNILMIKERELESFCYECGLKTITDEAGCKVLPAKQSLNLTKSGFQSFGLTKFEIFQSDALTSCRRLTGGKRERPLVQFSSIRACTKDKKWEEESFDCTIEYGGSMEKNFEPSFSQGLSTTSFPLVPNRPGSSSPGFHVFNSDQHKRAGPEP